MEKEQIIQVCKQYDTYIENMGYSIKMNKNPDNITDEYNHIRWMLSEIPNKLQNNKIEKANRWLGFIQGFLWCRGHYLIDDLKNHNR
jgi:hypothetical protein